MMKSILQTVVFKAGVVVAGAAMLSLGMQAQQLGWEGSTGVFVTPLAYTAGTAEKKIAKPTVAYHYLNGGSVLGTFSQISITSAFSNKVEFGYTRTIHAAGSNAALSPLWSDGFNTFHGKAALIRENAWKTKWMPQLSAGFTVRSQVRNVGGALTQKDTVNGDVYLVASKTITQIKPIPVLITAGIRGSVRAARTSEEHHHSGGGGIAATEPHPEPARRSDAHHAGLRRARTAQRQAAAECRFRHAAGAGTHCTRYRPAGTQPPGLRTVVQVLGDINL
jgi:hypothetical protein